MSEPFGRRGLRTAMRPALLAVIGVDVANLVIGVPTLLLGLVAIVLTIYALVLGFDALRALWHVAGQLDERRGSR